MELVAANNILYKNKQYRPGDVLPGDAEIKEIWLDCGSAILTDGTTETEKPAKARRVTAQSGLVGTAVNSESAENLVGRVPDTERRRRK